MKHLALLIALLIFPACALNRLTISDYSAAGKDKTLMDAEAGECDRKAERERPTAFTDGLALDAQYNRIYNACMEAKGYQRR